MGELDGLEPARRGVRALFCRSRVVAVAEAHRRGQTLDSLR
jgi:hypothetical protein